MGTAHNDRFNTETALLLHIIVVVGGVKTQGDATKGVTTQGTTTKVPQHRVS